MIKRILAVGALGSVGVLGLSALPAGAAPHLGPNVNLKLKNDVLNFKPRTLNLTVSSGTKCKVSNYEFSITNKSGSSQNIDLGGNPWQTMTSGEELFFCSGVGTLQFTVPGTGATLTVNTSS